MNSSIKIPREKKARFVDYCLKSGLCVEFISGFMMDEDMEFEVRIYGTTHNGFENPNRYTLHSFDKPLFDNILKEIEHL